MVCYFNMIQPRTRFSVILASLILVNRLFGHTLLWNLLFVPSDWCFVVAIRERAPAHSVSKDRVCQGQSEVRWSTSERVHPHLQATYLDGRTQHKIAGRVRSDRSKGKRVTRESSQPHPPRPLSSTHRRHSRCADSLRRGRLSSIGTDSQRLRDVESEGDEEQDWTDRRPNADPAG